MKKQTKQTKILLVQPDTTELSPYLAYAKENNIYFELLDFAIPYNLEEKARTEGFIETYQNSPFLKSMHGSFIDVTVSSPDLKIRNISRDRVIESLEIAKRLKLEYIVFHTNLTPNVLQSYYVDNWLYENTVFWKEMVDRYPNIVICFENVSDYNPTLMKKVIENVDSPRFQVCLDIGHCHCSRTSLEDWFEALAPYIKYVHLSDNCGIYDEHLPLGQGTVDFRNYQKCIEIYQIQPISVIELGFLEGVKESIAYLKKNKIYPYDE